MPICDAIKLKKKVYFCTLTAANAGKKNCWKEIRNKRPKASIKETILGTDHLSSLPIQ